MFPSRTKCGFISHSLLEVPFVLAMICRYESCRLIWSGHLPKCTRICSNTPGWFSRQHGSHIYLCVEVPDAHRELSEVFVDYLNVKFAFWPRILGRPSFFALEKLLISLLHKQVHFPSRI